MLLSLIKKWVTVAVKTALCYVERISLQCSCELQAGSSKWWGWIFSSNTPSPLTDVYELDACGCDLYEWEILCSFWVSALLISKWRYSPAWLRQEELRSPSGSKLNATCPCPSSHLQFALSLLRPLPNWNIMEKQDKLYLKHLMSGGLLFPTLRILRMGLYMMINSLLLQTIL